MMFIWITKTKCHNKIAKKHEISVDEVKRIIKQANRITSLKSPLDELWLDEADFH